MSMTINGHTRLLAHIGYPTHSFKAPLIYNPYFAQAHINAVVVPMGCRPDHFAALMQSLRHLDNFAGALITMPHKVSVLSLLDRVTPTVEVAGACNAVKVVDGCLVGDMFDGEGFVRGLRHKAFAPQGKRALVVGSGGVGSAIAASLAAAGVAELHLFDINAVAAQALATRLKQHYPAVRTVVGQRDPADMDLVVNATPLGMNPGDPLPIDMRRLQAHTLVGEVVMRAESTAFLSEARARGCRVQVGVDMLFEQIPAYLEFFNLPSTDAEELRRHARIAY